MTTSATYRPPCLPIVSDRVRKVDGGFAFIPHRFLREGFWASLSPEQLLLYLLLCLVSDRNGMSFYRTESLCSLLQLEHDLFVMARRALIDQDLVAFDGYRFQVLSLPAQPVLLSPKALCTDEDFEAHDPATIRQLLSTSLARSHRGPR